MRIAGGVCGGLVFNFLAETCLANSPQGNQPLPKIGAARNRSATATKHVRINLHPLRLLHKLRFKLHCADAVYFAINVVIAIDQSDVFDFGADLDHGG